MDSFLFLAALFLLLLLLGVHTASGGEAGFTAQDLESEASLRALFARWCSDNDKVFAHASEQDRRYEIFKENVRMIHAHNSQSHAYWMGLNRFSDLSNEEFRQRFTSPSAARRIPTYLKTKVASSGVSKKISGTAPASLDWRTKNVVTPVKDVGANCSGGTWAFATAGSVESLNSIVTGKLLDLSAQQLIDCDTENQGCKSGFPQYTFDYVLKAGLATSSVYPFTGTNGTCEKKNGYRVHIDDYDRVYEAEEDMEAALMEQVAKQPVTAVIDGSKPEFKSYSGGIYEGPCDDSNQVDLSVLIVGYGSDEKCGKDYWIIKNSWGTSWGEDGYMKLPRGTGVFGGKCGIHQFPWYPTKASAPPSPSQPPPPPSPSPPRPSPSPPPPSPPPPSPPPKPPQPSPYCPDCGPGAHCCCTFLFCFPRVFVCCPLKTSCTLLPGICW